jgi:hypothetical protein
MEVIVSGSDDWTKIEDTAGPTLHKSRVGHPPFFLSGER